MDVLAEPARYLPHITPVRLHDANVGDTAMNANECNRTPVGRPSWRVILIRAAGDLPYVAATFFAACIEDMHFQSPAAVGDKHNESAVGKPGRLVIHEPRKFGNLLQR